MPGLTEQSLSCGETGRVGCGEDIPPGIEYRQARMPRERSWDQRSRVSQKSEHPPGVFAGK